MKRFHQTLKTLVRPTVHGHPRRTPPKIDRFTELLQPPPTPPRTQPTDPDAGLHRPPRQTQIKNRGTADVCIVVCDGLKGLSEAINTVWDRAVIQTCVIHLLRNTFRLASRKY